MFTKTESKANWVREYNHDHGVRIQVSDKGAIKLSQVLPSGEVKFLACFTAPQAVAIANAAGDLGNVLTSPEYKQILDNKEAVREQAKIRASLEREAQKQALKAQSALETLKALGYEFKPKVG